MDFFIFPFSIYSLFTFYQEIEREYIQIDILLLVPVPLLLYVRKNNDVIGLFIIIISERRIGGAGINYETTNPFTEKNDSLRSPGTILYSRDCANSFYG